MTNKRLKNLDLNIANIHFFKLENFILYVTLICYIIDIGNLKYVVAMVGATIMFCIMVLRKGMNGHFLYEFKWLFLAILGLGAITLVMQAINGFNSYAINEVIYFITPLFFAFAYLQVNRGVDIEHVLNIIFIFYIIEFFVENISTLSLSGILSISIADSYSPYESGLSFICVVYIIYYFYKNKLLNVLIAWIFNYLSLKRFSLLCATLFVVLMLLQRLYNLIHRTNKVISINKKVTYLIAAFFILVPLILKTLLNDAFQEWFYDVTGVDIDVFMLSRFTRMELVASDTFVNKGLGSTTVFLTDYYQGVFVGTIHDNFNLHNDIFKIFIECGIIGTIIFTICFFKATKLKTFSVMLMAYLFAEMMVNHLLGAGTVSFWIVAYLILYALNRSEQSSDLALNKKNLSSEYNS